jgi:hypothetical protein
VAASVLAMAPTRIVNVEWLTPLQTANSGPPAPRRFHAADPATGVENLTLSTPQQAAVSFPPPEAS